MGEALLTALSSTQYSLESALHRELNNDRYGLSFAELDSVDEVTIIVIIFPYQSMNFHHRRDHSSSPSSFMMTTMCNHHRHHHLCNFFFPFSPSAHAIKHNGRSCDPLHPASLQSSCSCPSSSACSFPPFRFSLTCCALSFKGVGLV